MQEIEYILRMNTQKTPLTTSDLELVELHAFMSTVYFHFSACDKYNDKTNYKHVKTKRNERCFTLC